MSGAVPVLEIHDLRKSFGAVDALVGAALVCPAGEVTALVGDNGAGKSTLIRCITGVHPPDGGSITFKGESIGFASPTEALKSPARAADRDRHDCYREPNRRRSDRGQIISAWLCMSPCRSDHIFTR